MASTKSAAIVVKEKKPKSSPSHPPYVEMIKEAIVALKERTGSSQIAIAKFIEGKEKHLPANFKKSLLIQLKKLVANGKLVKVKHSFKLAPSQSVKSKPAAAAAAAEPKKKETVAEKKTAAPKKATTKKAAVVAPKTKAKKEAVKSPVKKEAAKKVKSLKVVKSPMKKAAPVSKKVKSIKSPKKKRVTAAAAKK